MSGFDFDLQVVFVEDVYGDIYAYELRDDEDEEVALIRCKTGDGRDVPAKELARLFANSPELFEATSEWCRHVREGASEETELATIERVTKVLARIEGRE